MMRKAVIALAIVSALAAAGPAVAAVKPATYKGKTKEGTAINVHVDRDGFAFIQTTLPTTCVSAQGGPPVTRLTTWGTTYEYPVGRESQVKDTSSYPTTHYTADVRRRGKVLVGKLRLSYSFLSYYYDGYRILTCAGDGSFKLRAR